MYHHAHVDMLSVKASNASLYPTVTAVTSNYNPILHLALLIVCCYLRAMLACDHVRWRCHTTQCFEELNVV